MKHFATIREIVGKKEETLEVENGTTLVDLLHILSKMYGPHFADYVYDKETGAPKEYLQFLINGRSARSLDGFRTKIVGDCQFAIIPPVGGGG